MPARAASAVKYVGIALGLAAVIWLTVMVVDLALPDPPAEVIVSGQSNFTLAVGDTPRVGFTLFRERGAECVKEENINITSPSEDDVKFWESCVGHSYVRDSYTAWYDLHDPRLERVGFFLVHAAWRKKALLCDPLMTKNTVKLALCTSLHK